jgi:hypothetical protein
MGLLINDEKEVIRHCHRCLEPLFDSYLLYENKLNVPFWYSFHSDNRVMIFCRLRVFRPVTWSIMILLLLKGIPRRVCHLFTT